MTETDTLPLPNPRLVNDEQKILLLSYSYSLAAARTKAELGTIINDRLKKICEIKDYLISTIDTPSQTHGGFLFNPNAPYTRRADFKEAMNKRFSIRDGLADTILNSADPVLFRLDIISKRRDVPAYIPYWRSIGISKVVGIALCVGNRHVGILWIEPEQGTEGTRLMGSFFKGIFAQLAIALSNILANEKIEAQLKEIEHFKQRLENENTYLQQQLESTITHKEIVGNGPEMQQVFHKIQQVAYSNSTILLLGETGTGKELIARAIHKASPRKNRLMIKVNCAALPANLIESELFGHEKGSFTGAAERRIGKFELADNSTLFLDEIGELPLELQVKLLRALQEREIERIGGNAPIKVNIRIIAATNRDLLKEIAAGKFRSDLYYRLNVFPLVLPPLRRRRTDLPILAAFFIEKFSRAMNRKAEMLSKRAEQELMTYEWPGNVRELEHVIERCVLLTPGNVITALNLLGNSAKKEIVKSAGTDLVKSLDENERDHICSVLEICKGKVSGPFGAARLLGIPVSTLNSKIVKLKIAKKEKTFIRV
jgi:formate hydrogenlyase transcriptional activator